MFMDTCFRGRMMAQNWLRQRTICSVNCDMTATRRQFLKYFQHRMEACKSLYPGSIPGEASKKPPLFSFVTDKSYLRQTKAKSAPAKTKLAALRSAAWMPIRVT